MKTRVLTRDWASLEAEHPPEIVRLFKDIVASVHTEIQACRLLIVGSFSDGTANYFLRSDCIECLSDIDLLVVLRDGEMQVLSRRGVISKKLDTLTRTLVSRYWGLKIGVRYRFESEIPNFALKCESLGYSVAKSGITLCGDPELNLASSDIDFDVGHAAENLCSKLWTIVRYVDLPDREDYSREVGVRAADRAEQCMSATVQYASRRARGASSEMVPTGWPGADTDRLSGLQYVIDFYGCLATKIAENRPLTCRAASRAEEFDCFRVTGNHPGKLPRALVSMLRFLCNYNQHQGVAAESIRTAARILGLGQAMDAKGDSPEGLYYQLRYEIARKRMAMSPLFRRDRGPTFLDLLGRWEHGRGVPSVSSLGRPNRRDHLSS